MENSRENALKDKSYAFSIRTINLYKHLTNRKREYVLSKQVLRSGTSIGANVAEANQAQSRADFISKLSIALKEAVETEYWLIYFVIRHTYHVMKRNQYCVTVRSS